MYSAYHVCTIIHYYLIKHMCKKYMDWSVNEHSNCECYSVQKPLYI